MAESGPEPTELHSGFGQGQGSSSNLPVEDEMKRNLVPSPPLVPWLPALRGALADIDGFESDRKPTWCGGCASCVFLIVFCIVLIVYVVQTAATSFTTTNQDIISTEDLVYRVNLQCLPDTPDGSYGDGTCNITVIYKQGKIVSANDPDRPLLTKYVPHPCQTFEKVANSVQVGSGTEVALCFSWGLFDGVWVETTPNQTRAAFVEAQTYYYVPQDYGGVYDLSVQITTNGSFQTWDFAPYTISQAPNTTNSTAHIKLADTTLSFIDTTYYQSPSVGDIGGAAFLLWLILKFLADVHFRCTREYKGQLEAPVAPKQRRPST